MADKAKTKAVEGSFEHLRELLTAAIREAGLFGGDFYITNTFADSVTLCTYGLYGAKPVHWRLSYTVDEEDAIVLGEAEKVAIVEVIVSAEDNTGVAEEDDDSGGEYSADDVEAKASGELQHKTVDFEVKAVADDTVNGVKGWTFEGYASVWNVVDRENDVTIKGCFARSLAEHGLPIAREEHARTVGKYLDAKEDDHGMWLKGFIPDDPATELLHKLMKIGALAKMSIGWRPYPGGMTKRADGVRELRAIELVEASICGTPMLPATSITNVKGLTGVLPDTKFDERIDTATRALQEAVADAGALVGRRVAQDRALSTKSVEAVAGLAVASGDALLSLLAVEGKAGRSLPAARRRHLADLARSLEAFLAALPDAEREEVESLIEGAARESAPDDAEAKASRRRREAEMFELKLRRYARAEKGVAP